MKKLALILLAVIPLTSLGISADSTESRRVDRIKRGWNLGPIPVIAFDSDLGFEYGAVVNFFNYGDGTNYPEYRHSLYTEASQYTKGSGMYRLIYDSKYAIPGVRLMADVQYLPTLAFDFYGYNGGQSRYNKDWTETGNAAFRSEQFYKMNKDILRAGLDLQGSFSDKRFGWLLGASIQKVDVGSLKAGRLSISDQEASDILYNKYVSWGIIKDWEKKGGTHTALKGALIYDTRDNEPNPMRGVWADALLYYVSPAIAHESRGHLKLALTFRKYFTLVDNDLSLAFRAMSQNIVAGTAPFYMLSQIVTVSPRRSSFEGLGGSYSLRGMLRNRMVADGFALANLELRYKFWRLHLLRQNFYLAINPFVDAGMITEKTAVDLSKVPASEYDKYFKNVDQKPHFTYGLGGKLVMNQNFVISGDIGKAVDSQDGNLGIYIGVNFLF